MSGGPSYPKASPYEQILQMQQIQALNQQNSMLQQQFNQQQLLAPVMYQQAGLIPQYGSQQVTGQFDPQWYLQQYPGVAEAAQRTGQDPVAFAYQHYYTTGQAQGFQPGPSTTQQVITGFSMDPNGTPEQQLFRAQVEAAQQALQQQQDFQQSLFGQQANLQIGLQGQVLAAQQAQANQAQAAAQRLEALQSSQFGQQMDLQKQVLAGQQSQAQFAQQAFQQQMQYLQQQGALTQQEVNMLTEQQRLQGILTPVQLEAAGYLPRYNDQGQLTGVTKRPLTEEEQVMQEVQLLTGKRTLAALKGELPVDPALTRNLDESERNLRENLRKQLGPDYETSSPGIEALARFQEGKNAALYAARTGDIQLAGNLGLNLNQQSIAQQGLNFQKLIQTGNAPLGSISATAQGIQSIPTLAPSFAGIQQTPQTLNLGTGGIPIYSMFGSTQPGNLGSGAYNMGLIGNAGGFPYQGSSALGTLSQLYSGPLSYLGQQRAFDYQDAMKDYQARAGVYGSLIGSVLGAAGGYFGGQQGAQAGWQSGQAFGMAIA